MSVSMATSKPRLVAIRYRLFLLCLATVAFGSILVETSSYGIGVSPDSVRYIRLARQLAQPGELFALFGSPVFVSQPPLFPIVLAWIEKATGADPFVSVRFLNALLFAIILYVTGAFFFGRADEPPHPVIAFAVPFFVLFSRWLHLVFAMAWTEPLFILSALLFLVSMSRYLADGSPRSLLGAALLAIVAVYTRYSGVTLIVAGALLVPFASNRSMRRRATDLFLFAGSTSAVFGIWVARNLHLSGTSFGGRSPAVYSLAENVVLSLSVFQSPFFPEGREFPLLLKFSIAAAVGLLALWTYAPLGGYFKERVAKERAVLMPCLVFSLVFYAFTIITSTTVAYDPIDFRLLSPIYVPVLIVAASLASDAMRYARSGESRGRRIRTVTVLLVAMALVQPVRQFAVDFGDRFREGSGLNRRVFIESELMGFLKTWGEIERGKPIYSNAPMALAWHLGLDARRSPDRKKCASAIGERARECFLETTDPEFFDAYLLYFEEKKYPYHYSFDELARWVELTPVEVTSDGGVYEVSRREPET
jgi:hypothetical protein